MGLSSRKVISGQGGSEQPLLWIENAQEWSYDLLKLYYHRNLDGTEHFLAMTDLKEEVVWNPERRAWVKAGDPTWKWEGAWKPL
jgi:hypothetical protein